ncbi:hypothetical protein, partial [Salinibacter ruber]|uniref:hypothetical protein n=1 Tax=Salinibacter ruber TaxID=146919 RepID=UPI0020734C19
MGWLFRCIGSFLAMFSTWFTTGPPSLSKGKALWVLVGLSGGLAAALLADIYVDWARQEDLLWSTLLENAVPLGLALSVSRDRDGSDIVLLHRMGPAGWTHA